MNKTVVEKHFDKVADTYDKGKKRYSYYYSSLKKLLMELIGKNKKVFEFGCGTGDLLVSLNPKLGFGMDISGKMIETAREKHSNKKNITFSTSMPKEKFDYIFLSDVVEHLNDHRSMFKELVSVMNSDTKIIVTMANPIWEPLLMIWEAFGLKMKEGKHKRVSFGELKKILESLGLKVIKHDYRLLVPIKIPLVTEFANKYLEKIFKPLCFVEYFVVSKT